MTAHNHSNRVVGCFRCDLSADEVRWQPPAPRTELIWAAIDLDGTLAEGVWTPESNGREIGAPIERNVRKLEALRSAGYKTVIHSSRGWEHYEAVEAWLDFYRIPHDRIVLGKLLAAIYVDDRAVESEQRDWSPYLQAHRQATNRAYYGDDPAEWVPNAIKF